MNPFPHSNDNKRYHSLSYYNKTVFHQKIYKATLNANLPCYKTQNMLPPCYFCKDNSVLFTKGELSIIDQVNLEIQRLNSKHGEIKVIGYFQSGTNTNCEVSTLKSLIEPVLSSPYVIGISLSTRPDCLSLDMLNYLEELSKDTYLTVELGLQSSYDSTLKYLNRNHSFTDYAHSHEELKKRGIRVCTHLINSLPFETREMMINTAKNIGKLQPDAVKIHMLNIMEGTELERRYIKGEFTLMSLEEYVNTTVSQIEHLPMTTVIERLSGDECKDSLIAPIWCKDKLKVLNAIDKCFFERDSFQGKYY